ncbi:MAG TPA: hypothetical protein DIT63_12690, partial [Gammaproteobacteria bacterium]|nr:hypothetical protein [Gammaproteobacteria bacterium]
SLPLVALGVARSRTLIAEDLPRFNLLAAGVNLVANALLAWWLIPPLGATGAAWASVLPRLVSVVAINFLFARTRRQGVVMVRGLWAPGVLFGYLRARRAT